jgi:hypothetical protein
LSDSLWKMQQSFTHAFSFQCHLRYNSVSAAVNNLNDGLFASTSAWQSMASCGLQPGNIWQHLATRVTACHYITEVVPEGYCVVFSGSKQSLGLGLQTSPRNYGTHGTHGSWAVEPCWSCDKLRLLPTLARRQRSRSLFFALVSGQLFVPIFMAFHGTAMKFQQKHWIHCREVWSLGVTGESLE